jgi:NAD(P)H-hydrate epimerase
MSYSWLDPLYTADEMRALDAWAIEEQGVPSLDLMERAAAEVTSVVTERAPQGTVAVVCGKGNNGGDGLAVTRMLAEHGIQARALLLWPAEELRGDARVNYDRLVDAGCDADEVEPAAISDALAGAALIIDAILGTGFEGTPREPADGAIEAVNRAGSPVIAIDVPSGVNASTGSVDGAAVRADVTVTFQAAKTGLWISPGKEHAGRVVVADIGIPREGRMSPTSGLIRREAVEAIPRRAAASTKFSSGSVLVIGGSLGLTGAVAMSCEGAMRAGAGWVRAAVPASLNEIFEVKLTEVMSVPLADDGGHLRKDAVEAALDAADRADCVALGPGLGRDPEALDAAIAVMDGVQVPLLIDADGLFALAEADLERVAGRRAPTVLTPHAGELARLLATDSGDIAAARLGKVREAARRANAIVVLKGDDTLVADPGGWLGVSPGGSPALATAGTGDVLSGVIAAFMAKGVEPFTAVCAGVRAHVDAGRIAAQRIGVADSVIATDVIAAIPAALRPGDAGSPSA